MTINNTIQALNDQTRREILQLLKKKDMGVGEIALNFNITLPSLSHHLNILKQADLVSSRRQGQEIIYSLNLSAFEQAAKAVMKIFNRKK